MKKTEPFANGENRRVYRCRQDFSEAESVLHIQYKDIGALMNTFQIEKDIPVVYETADSFPNGIQAAFDSLHKKLGDKKQRKIFGMSRPEGKKGIVYRACAEELFPGEAEKLALPKLVIQAGNWYCTEIKDVMKDPSQIEEAFREYIYKPDIDPDGYCVELYSEDNRDVKCLVRKK
ncbi:MAG TPA: hypothetical protein PK453_05400 [Leptospiraceae bacterium]|nr:hypothetical protein [Leptospiraceae bacterium]HNF23072.1 hypothetical protein [Leptospiraceae bacterium]HNH09963.1 hypothetical protein [Leptospiraceae bacterium]HNI26318.1 hypothetical protein [Leptospiraceae bacterium]HNI95899.1 hypothetical protein [Leptospiraceae bacterium]